MIAYLFYALIRGENSVTVRRLADDHPLRRSILTALAFPSAATWRRSTPASGCSSRRYSPGPERFLYSVLRVDPKREQDWKGYAKSLIIFSLAGWLLLYFILRTQTLVGPHAA